LTLELLFVPAAAPPLARRARARGGGAEPLRASAAEERGERSAGSSASRSSARAREDARAAVTAALGTQPP
jgi:hypothetical protein